MTYMLSFINFLLYIRIGTRFSKFDRCGLIQLNKTANCSKFTLPTSYDREVWNVSIIFTPKRWVVDVTFYFLPDKVRNPSITRTLKLIALYSLVQRIGFEFRSNPIFCMEFFETFLRMQGTARIFRLYSSPNIILIFNFTKLMKNSYLERIWSTAWPCVTIKIVP